MQAPATADVVREVKNKLKMKGATIPSSFPIDDGYHLTASIEGNRLDSYEVIFYQAKRAIPINDTSLQPNGDVPVIASIIARTYEDPNNATDIFSPVNANSGPVAVDLGHGIKGFAEGAAGHSYLNWREGNWILQIESLLQDKMNNQGIAKKMVAYLETHALPAPKDKGRVKVIYKPGGKHVNVGIYWKKGKVIYQLETDKVPKCCTRENENDF